MFQIKKAVRTQRPFKGCFAGVSGAGKTYSALQVAKGLVPNGKIVVIDSENNSSTLYADSVEFDVLNLPNKEIATYIKAIEHCADYDCIIIDSASHAWESTLEAKTAIDMRGGNSFTNWGKITPEWNRLIRTIVDCKTNIIATMRSKSDYVMEQDSKGKQLPKKVGLTSIFREGAEYEFDVYGFIDLDHNLVIEKSRYPFLADKVINKPDSNLGASIAKWLNSGAENAEPEIYFYDFNSLDSERQKWVVDNLPSKYNAKELAPLVYSTRIDLGAKFEQFKTLIPIEKPKTEDDIFGLTSGNVLDSDAVNELQENNQEH